MQLQVPQWKPSTWLAIGATVLGLSYVIYFDQKRRNDPDFRRKLKKQRKKVQKISEKAKSTTSESAAPSAENALSFVEDEVYPTAPEEKEKYFMEQLAKGETISKGGPATYEAAAACFYKALKVYPNPVDLIMLYQKTIPEPIFNLVMGMMTAEVKKKQEKYYEQFPPSEYNVKIKEVVNGVAPDGQTVVKRAVVAEKDFEVGEVIYAEEPIVAALEPQLEGEFCTFSLQQITPEVDEWSVTSDNTKLKYSSQPNRELAETKYESLLYPTPDSDTLQIHQLCNDHETKIPIMVARFLALMVIEDQQRGEQGNTEEYSIWDHIERLKYLELESTEKEKKEADMLRKVLGSKVPGLDEFLTDERYLLLKGKFLYNQYAISTAVESSSLDIKQSAETTRFSTPTPTGAGLYPVSSYLGHSSEPSAEVDFPEGTSKMSIKAKTPIKKGDVVTVSYVNPEKTPSERKDLLSKGWRFQDEELATESLQEVE
ncbi:MAS20 protein import receptor-domain-containing protein [Paraphysoderma sedebokerense]|nr:MAS20 protein import receptor-domain-containing protein [Paraphysoderma sedebokerense]